MGGHAGCSRDGCGGGEARERERERGREGHDDISYDTGSEHIGVVLSVAVEAGERSQLHLATTAANTSTDMQLTLLQLHYSLRLSPQNKHPILRNKMGPLNCVAAVEVFKVASQSSMEDGDLTS